jgi:hypothetical protein
MFGFEIGLCGIQITADWMFVFPFQRLVKELRNIYLAQSLEEAERRLVELSALE